MHITIQAVSPPKANQLYVFIRATVLKDKRNMYYAYVMTYFILSSIERLFAGVQESYGGVFLFNIIKC